MKRRPVEDFLPTSVEVTGFMIAFMYIWTILAAPVGGFLSFVGVIAVVALSACFFVCDVLDKLPLRLMAAKIAVLLVLALPVISFLIWRSLLQ